MPRKKDEITENPEELNTKLNSDSDTTQLADDGQNPENIGQDLSQGDAEQGHDRQSAQPKPVSEMSKKEFEEAKKKVKERQKRMEGQEIINTNDWTAFRIVVGIIGAIIIGLGAWGLFSGIDGILGSSDAVNIDQNTNDYSSIQSNYAFFNGLYAALGASFIAVAIQFRWAQIIWVSAIMIFAGGVARLYSMARWGSPNALLVVFIILELALPVALIVWYMWIARSAKIKAEASAVANGNQQK